MKWMFTGPLLALVLSCVGLVGCGAGGGDTEIATNSDLRTTTTDTSDVLFERNRVLQIDIEMDPSEYDLLRGEGWLEPRSGGDADDNQLLVARRHVEFQ